MLILPNYKNFTWPLTHSCFPTPLSRTKEGSPQLPQPLQWDTSHTQSQSCMRSFTWSQVDAPRELVRYWRFLGRKVFWASLLLASVIRAHSYRGWRLQGVRLSNLGTDPSLSDVARCWNYLAWYPNHTSFYAPFNKSKHWEQGFSGIRWPHTAWSVKRSKGKEPDLLAFVSTLWSCLCHKLYSKWVPVPSVEKLGSS